VRGINFLKVHWSEALSPINTVLGLGDKNNKIYRQTQKTKFCIELSIFVRFLFENKSKDIYKNVANVYQYNYHN